MKETVARQSSGLGQMHIFAFSLPSRCISSILPVSPILLMSSRNHGAVLCENSPYCCVRSHEIARAARAPREIRLGIVP